MKIRTVYLKVPDMNKAVEFWKTFLGFDPHKRSEFWSEFKCQNINLGLLKMENFSIEQDKCNCVPVFEYADAEYKQAVEHAKRINAQIIVDSKDHPDKMSYVFADPFGHEFEVTKFHD